MVRDNKRPSGNIVLPKTEKSIRDIDLRAAAVAVLKLQFERTGLANGYVFLNDSGKSWSYDQMRQKFSHYMRLAKLKQRSPGQMRHTFATLRLQSGENTRWVQRMLGHASVATTLEHYDRFIPNLTHDDGILFEENMYSNDPFWIKIMGPDGQNGNNLVTLEH